MAGTALFISAQNGYAHCVKELVKAGAALNITDIKNQTALIAAVLQGHVKCLEKLIAAGADVNKYDEKGKTALLFSVEKDHTKCVTELLKAKADPNIADEKGKTALTVGASRGQVDILKELIDAGADVNSEYITGSYTDKLKLPLFCCVIAKTVECVNVLVEAGANLHARNYVGNTPLIEAVNAGNEEIIRLLLEAGSDVNLENDEGKTVLYLVVAQCHAEAARIHAEREKNFVADFPTTTPCSAHLRIFQALLPAEAHLNKTRSGLSPITAHLKPKCLEEPNLQILKILTVAGANIEAAKTFIYDPTCLQDIARDFIRKHLKQIHPAQPFHNLEFHTECRPTCFSTHC